jgi:PKD repeat protein
MNRIILLSIILVSAILSNAQDSISVLFVGNSYTYVNDLPAMTSNLAISLGDEITFDSKTNGGFTFANQLNDPLTHTKIQSKPWDYVVLQAQSQEPSFPYSQVNTNTLPQAVQLADSVYDNRYCSQAMFFMTWGREVGDPQWDSINTFYKMNDRLRLAYLRFVDSTESSVAPVGVAWRYIRDNHPTIQLYSGDGSHPSVAGTYLAACTFYASLFRKSPVGASYISTLDATTAGILQNAASLCVLDSLESWHLRSNEEVAIAGFASTTSDLSVQFTNTSWRSTEYYWTFGDGATSSLINPQHTYAVDGNYTVTLIASNECGDDTIQQVVSVEVAALILNNLDLFKIAQLEKGLFLLSSPIHLSMNDIVLVDLLGNEISSKAIKVDSKIGEVQIDLRNFADGIYMIQFSSNGQQFQGKIYN